MVDASRTGNLDEMKSRGNSLPNRILGLIFFYASPPMPFMHNNCLCLRLTGCVSISMQHVPPLPGRSYSSILR
jgi:hypothetical protein